MSWAKFSTKPVTAVASPGAIALTADNSTRPSWGSGASIGALVMVMVMVMMVLMSTTALFAHGCDRTGPGPDVRPLPASQGCHCRGRVSWCSPDRNWTLLDALIIELRAPGWPVTSWPNTF